MVLLDSPHPPCRLPHLTHGAPLPSPPLPNKRYFLDPNSGTISTSSFIDRLLGRLSALFHGELIDGINDHGTSEYCRLFKQAIIASRLSLLDKTKSVMITAVQKVIFLCFPYATEMRQGLEYCSCSWFFLVSLLCAGASLSSPSCLLRPCDLRQSVGHFDAE